MTDVNVGTPGGGVTQATPPNGNAGPGMSWPIDVSQPSTWVWVIFAGSVLYLLGAYVALGRYRIPV